MKLRVEGKWELTRQRGKGRAFHAEQQHVWSIWPDWLPCKCEELKDQNTRTSVAKEENGARWVARKISGSQILQGFVGHFEDLVLKFKIKKRPLKGVK